MVLQFLSDLHLEKPAHAAFVEENPIKVLGDILVMAGDISEIGHTSAAIERFWDWCGDNFEQTYIVPGNHEFYCGLDLADTLKPFSYMVRSNVNYLNNLCVTIDGKTAIFFTTLWTHLTYNENENPLLLDDPDFQNVKFDGRRLTAEAYNEAHDVCLEMLKDSVAASTAEQKIVVTHHCPINAEHPRYKGNGLTECFVAPLESYITTSGIDYWIHGHTHYNGATHKLIGKTLILSNQFGSLRPETGKPEEGFSPAAAIMTNLKGR